MLFLFCLTFYRHQKQPMNAVSYARNRCLRYSLSGTDTCDQYRFATRYTAQITRKTPAVVFPCAGGRPLFRNQPTTTVPLLDRSYRCCSCCSCGYGLSQTLDVDCEPRGGAGRSARDGSRRLASSVQEGTPPASDHEAAQGPHLPRLRCWRGSRRRRRRRRRRYCRCATTTASSTSGSGSGSPDGLSLRRQ